MQKPLEQGTEYYAHIAIMMWLFMILHGWKCLVRIAAQHQINMIGMKRHHDRYN